MNYFSFPNKSPSFLFFFILFFLFNSCQGHSLREVEVMTYNIENLFDLEHDIGKRDWEYLPKEFLGKKENCQKIRSRRYRKKCLESDWTLERLNLKLSQIKKVFFSKKKKRPEILALVEIENDRVIKLLAKELGYSDWIVSRSPDKRGVDVALLYNESQAFKKLRSREHILKGSYFKKRPTRNILEGQFLINGKYKLLVFVNHWPSQANPTGSRLKAAELLKDIIEKRQKEEANQGILAVGDFNILDYENPNPIKNILFKIKGFQDVHKIFMKDPSISQKEKNKMPLGTYFYPPKREWNRFDRIFVNKFLTNFRRKKGLKLNSSTYEIYNPSFLTTTYYYKKGQENKFSLDVKGIPYRYNFLANRSNKAGFSDHFPVLVKLRVD